MRSSKGLIAGLLTAAFAGWLTIVATLAPAQLSTTGAGGAGGAAAPFNLATEATWYANFTDGTGSGTVNQVSTTFANMLTVTRASVGWAQASGAYGLWSQFTNNTVRFTNKGMPVEGLRSNIAGTAGNGRDCSVAGWVKVNTTCTKTATGADGVANSASKVTATGAGGTVTFVTVSGSSARWQSALVQCGGTCTGTIGMSLDILGGYTTLDISNCVDGTGTATAINVTGYVRCTIASATETNATLGFSIQNSGDIYNIDFVVNENSSVFGSTVFSASSRSAETVTITDSSMMSLAQGTWFAEYGPIWGMGSIFREVAMMRVDGSNKLGIEICGNSTSPCVLDSPQAYSFALGAFTAQLTSGTAVNTTGTYRTAFAYTTNDYAAAFTPALNPSVLTTASGATPTGTFAVHPGNNNGAQQLYGYLRLLAYVPTRKSNGIIQTWAQP